MISQPSTLPHRDRLLKHVSDSSTQIVEAIWPTSSVICRGESVNSGVLPLRRFIQETLRRSRTSYSTLQVALYYLVLIKDRLPDRDFTMEQTEDCHASRALQCGRRMFLAALILASKYLQDRNYSARAWSKISGLNTNEINQNEMAFVLAVNWKLHITEEVYHRWTDCVMKYSPSQPPSPGSSPIEAQVASAQFQHECDVFKRIIRRLNSDLENLEEVLYMDRHSPVPSLSPRSLSPRSVLAAARDESAVLDFAPRPALSMPLVNHAPSVMEPSPSSTPQVLGRLAPNFGFLPTPRLTPQLSAVRDPSTPQLVSCGSAMSLAVSTAGSVQSGIMLDRWACNVSSSPLNYSTPRRSSLAASISTVSSPESMVSDVSGSSRTSSVSSISSLAAAPYSKLEHTNLGVQARCRSAKMVDFRYAPRPSVTSSYSGEYLTTEGISASPTSYSSSLESGIFGCAKQDRAREFEVDEATNDAAQTLQALHDNWQRALAARSTTELAAPKAGSKRSRPGSAEHVLQDNVRELLHEDSNIKTSAYARVQGHGQIPVASGAGRNKRICCSAEAAQFQTPTMHPSLGGLGAPGMWTGILN